MSKRKFISTNMHKALQNIYSNNSLVNTKRPAPILRIGGQPIPIKKTGGCGCNNVKTKL